MKNWKISGGKITIRKRISKKLRATLIQNENCSCSKCGKKSLSLRIHHKKPVALGGTNAPENLEVLCKDCHRDAHPQLKAIFRDYVSLPWKCPVCSENSLDFYFTGSWVKRICGNCGYENIIRKRRFCKLSLPSEPETSCWFFFNNLIIDTSK
ncbi:HNH endonuclease [Candidatus Pacearchaeota archaeon]|nr:HNH endonuclease [Candidatus Pacearchaeota archaeon]